LKETTPVLLIDRPETLMPAPATRFKAPADPSREVTPVFVTVKPEIDIPDPPDKLSAPVEPPREVTPALVTVMLPVLEEIEIPVPAAKFVTPAVLLGLSG